MNKHPLDKYPLEYIPRSQIKEHPGNPRDMSVSNRRRLKASLTKNGLMDVLTWNKRTGHLLSGHQRLKALDATADGEFDVPVKVVDFDEGQEAAALIAMNNEQAQGDWNFEQLTELIKQIKPDEVDATGFDAASLHSIFGADVTGVFPDVAAQIEQNKQVFSAKHDKADEAKLQVAEEVYTTGEDRLTKGREALGPKEMKFVESDQGFQVSVVCLDIGQRDAFMRRIGQEPDGFGIQFVDVRDVIARMKD